MKYLVIPWDNNYQGAEDVLIAISKLRNDRGLQLNIVPDFFWFKKENAFIQTMELFPK